MLNSNLFADWAAAHAYRGRAVVLGPGSDNLEARLAVECRSRVPRPAPVIAPLPRFTASLRASPGFNADMIRPSGQVLRLWPAAITATKHSFDVALRSRLSRAFRFEALHQHLVHLRFVPANRSVATFTLYEPRPFSRDSSPSANHGASSHSNPTQHGLNTLRHDTTSPPLRCVKRIL